MNYRVARQNTSKLLDMLEEGVISAEQVAEMCLGFMSEQDVTEMMEANELLEDSEEV